MRKIWICLALLSISTTTFAQMPEKAGPQFGVSVTRGKLDQTFDISPGVAYRISGEATGWNAFAGWRFNRYLAVEASYYDRLDDDGVLSPTTAVLSVRAKAYAGSILGSFPIGEYFSVFARAGYAHWQADEKLSFGALSATDRETGNDLIYGAGISGAFDGGVIRLEYDKLDVDFADVKIWSLGVAWYLQAH